MQLSSLQSQHLYQIIKDKSRHYAHCQYEEKENIKENKMVILIVIIHLSVNHKVGFNFMIKTFQISQAPINFSDLMSESPQNN